MDAALNDTARVLAIFNQPASVAVAGPKPLGQRISFKTLMRATRNTLYAIILLGSAANVMLMTGLPQDYVASKTPVSTIESAPVNVHWVSVASSPFLEAGRLSDGSLSTMAMLHTWRDAGLPANKVDTVRQALPALMPTLMGREDAHLEVELTLDAKAAAARLESTFPQVAQHLRAGTKAVLTEEEKLEWDDRLSMLDQAFYTQVAPLSPWTLGDAVAHQVAGAGNMNYGSSLSAGFPLLKAGLNEDGTLNPDKLADAWQAAGIEWSEAMMLQSELAASIPDLRHGSLQDKLNRAQDAQDLRASMRESLDLPIARLITGQTVTLGEKATAEWQKYRGEFIAEIQATQAVQEVTMAQAKQALEAAMHVTGLRSLSLPVENWSSPEELMRNAQRLTQANAELEQATGWKGQVLGLNGRVELTLGKPVMVGHADGVTLGDASGRLQVTSDWNALGHEWFHAFDFTLGRLGIQHSDGDPMSDNLEPLRKRKDATVFDAMKVAERALRDQAPQWQAHREKASEEGNTGYWVRAAEGMAFAFAAQLGQQGVKALSDVDRSMAVAMTPARSPNASEVQQQTAVFQTLFAKTAYLQLADGPAPQAPALGQWREGRGHASPLAAKREATLR